MNRLLTATGVLAFVAGMSPSLSAQWPSYPTPGVPRTPEGKPNPSAPAPKTADGNPDLTGIWEPTWIIEFRKQTPAPSPTVSGPPAATFANIGAGFPEGLP